MTTDPPNDAVTKLISALSSQEPEVRHTIVAELYNLPPPSELPRPSQVRAWNLPEWLAWGKPYGFVELERSTHAYRMVHPLFTDLRVHVASSPGDLRSRLNLGQQVRAVFRTNYDALALVGLSILRRDAEAYRAAGMSNDETFIRSDLMQRLAAPGAQVSLVDALAEALPRGDDSTEVDAQRALRLLQRVASESGESPRAVLARLTPGRDDADAASAAAHVERLYSALMQGLILSKDFVDNLTDGLQRELEVLEILEADAKAQKQAAREAQEAEKAKRKAEAAEAAETPKASTDSPEAFASHMAGVRAKSQSLTEPVMALLTDLANGVKALAQHANTFPSPTYPGDIIKALEADKAALAESLAAAETVTAELRADRLVIGEALVKAKADCATAETLLADAAASGHWLTQYREMVTHLDAALSSSDFLALADGVRLARLTITDAKAKLLAHDEGRNHG